VEQHALKHGHQRGVQQREVVHGVLVRDVELDEQQHVVKHEHHGQQRELSALVHERHEKLRDESQHHQRTGDVRDQRGELGMSDGQNQSCDEHHDG
jgi:hypothetical protein